MNPFWAYIWLKTRSKAFAMLTKMLFTLFLLAGALVAFLFLVRYLVRSTVESLSGLGKLFRKEKPRASAMVEAAFRDLEMVMSKLNKAKLPDARTARLRHGHAMMAQMIEKMRENPDLTSADALNDDFTNSARRLRQDATALIEDKTHKEAEDLLIGLDVLNAQLDRQRV